MTLLCPSYAAYVKELPFFIFQAYTQLKMGKKIRVVRTVDVDDLKRGGKLGGTATAKNRSAEEREAAARLAAKARWDAYYEAHPEKKQTARTGASRKKGN
jgi:hypothetical protein